MTFSIKCSAVGRNFLTPENVSQSGNGSLHANNNYQDDAGHEKKYHHRLVSISPNEQSQEGSEDQSKSRPETVSSVAIVAQPDEATDTIAKTE